MARNRGLRTDVGTIVWHWTMAVLLTIVVLTGLRIGSDEPDLRWLRLFDALLPRENLWYWHLLGALGFVAALVAYIVYVLSARLSRRIKLDTTRFVMLARPGPARWSPAGVILLWLVFGALTIEIISGTMMFVGQDGWATMLHRNAVWVCIAFPVLHVLLHLAYGGPNHLLRVFRPTRLTASPPEPDVLALLAQHIQTVDALRHGKPAGILAPANEPQRARFPPLLLASLVGTLVVGLGLVFTASTAMVLDVAVVGNDYGVEAPVVDGDIDDAAWLGTRPVRLLTDMGANFGGSGQSHVEIRAVHDADHIYFAFTWEDPTRSYRHMPLMKTAAGWRLVTTADTLANEEQLSEDRFSVLLSPPTVPILGAAIHLAARPLPDYPASASGRGLHYVGSAGLLDVWLWGSSHGGLIGFLEDDHFGPPAKPEPEQLAGKVRYRGGFERDDGMACFDDNYHDPGLGNTEPIHPLRMPLDLQQVAGLVESVSGGADTSSDEMTRWWMMARETRPYAEQRDQAVPAGTVIPSVVMSCVPSGDVADVQGLARWSAGRWTLEVVRKLDTGSAQDVPMTSGTMMWVSAFDHAATHHTRHIRAVTLALH